MEITRTTDLPGALKPRLMKKHVTIWRAGERAVPDRSWSMLRSDYKIKMDKKGNLAVLVPSERPSWYRGMYQGVRRTLSSTLHEWKVGLSYLCPQLGFSMRCQAFLQEHPGSTSFGLVISCCHDDEAQSSRTGFQLVGGAMHPKYINPGSIQVRVISHEIEADVIHGEDTNLTKVETDFRGRQFDVQFACKFKGKRVTEGVFGKVVVEQLCNQEASPLFEFNLTKGVNDTPEAVRDPDQNKWSVMPVRELASMLNILEEENWRSFAFNLRFTEREVAQLSTSSDPFSAMLLMYQSRGGSPDQFMTAMYEVSRMLHVGGYITRSPSRDSAYSSQHNMPTRILGDFEDSDEINGLDSVSQMGPVTVSAQVSNKYNLPLTPPATPRKRQRGLDRTPSKRVRRCLLTPGDDSVTPLPDDAADTVLLGDQQESSGNPDTNPDRIPLKHLSCQNPQSDDTVILEDTDSDEHCNDNNTYPQQQNTQSCNTNKDINDINRHCRIPVGPTTLWYVHSHVQSLWRTLGSHLGVPEYDLDSIAKQHKDMNERAYQVLYKWKFLYPENFVYGDLYSALCDSNLQSVAEKYCRNRGEPY